jgi:hypothetical protein
MRTRHQSVRFENADSERDGDTAEVRARLATSRDGILQRRFRLVRAPGSRSWKITHFELAV